MFSPGLVVITGPMFSGKSTELIRRLTIANIAKLPVVVYKPARDTRTATQICSRDGCCIAATTVAHPRDMLPLSADARVVGIDEAHFFEDGLPEVAMTLARAGKQVIVAGLNLDFQERPFACIPALLALAEEIVQMHALCTACYERPATRSQRLAGGMEQYQVGDSEYAPRCLVCYRPTT
ncbi:thymidine kinase [Candidatus Parcubacteria bacterium]|nr:thymidine kinase [Candidatus Parcubacteria bacterium]